MITEALGELGYKVKVDEDGDLFIRYQMKTIYFMTGAEDERYVVSLLPQFSDIHEGEETLVLAACNKVTREVKLAKVYVDQSLKSVTASCEFYFTDGESLKDSLEHSLGILGMVRSTYLKTKAEFSE